MEEDIRGYIERIKEEQSRLLASIGSLPVGFLIIDIKNNILIKNKAIEQILDLKDLEGSILLRGDIVNVEDKFKPDFDLRKAYEGCMQEKKPLEFKEVSFGKKFLRIFIGPVTIEGLESDVVGATILVEDITEAKVMERSRDEFFAVASHELRTPLTAIRGNTDMILSMYKDKLVDKDMKDMKEMLEDIDASSVRLIQVVNDFLEVSRLEQGKIDIKKETFALTDITEKVVRDLKEMISQKGLTLLYTPPTSPLPSVSADKGRLEQVLVNLVGNAAKFSKEGSITISIEHTGAFLRVRIIDTGAGISEHNQARLFRKFQQAGEDMLARDVSQSTGLGLYISKLIMNNMGGEIGLEKSELGKGSTFYFTVPTAA